MQSNQSVVQHNEQQPGLPSYAEAIRTAPPLNFSHNQSNTTAQESFHPTVPIYGPETVFVHTQYSNQPNYTQVPLPPAGHPYPPTYTTNAYPQYGQTATNLENPTTIHIIRPVSTRSTYCTGRSGWIIGIVLGIVVAGTILRVTMNR